MYLKETEADKVTGQIVDVVGVKQQGVAENE